MPGEDPGYLTSAEKRRSNSGKPVGGWGQLPIWGMVSNYNRVIKIAFGWGQFPFSKMTSNCNGMGN